MENKLDFEITFDPKPLEGRSDYFMSVGEELLNHVTVRNKPNLKKVERFFEKWKQFPEVWNWYYQALKKNNRMVEADKLLNETLKRFPDYHFAKCEYIFSLLKKDEIEKAISQLGGDEPDIKRWYPDRDVFHFQEAIVYYALYMELEIKKGNFEKADEYLDLVREWDVKDRVVKVYAEKILDARSKKEYDDFFEREENYTYVKPEPPENYEFSKDFVHPEIEFLYENNEPITDEFIASVLSLPRDTAILDLEKILYLCMFDPEEMDLELGRFTSLQHAVWFLYELNAVESSELISFILQMDAEFMDWWFGDFSSENLWQTIYICLEKELDNFLTIVKNPNLYTFFKSIVLDALEFYAEQSLENKSSVTEILGNLLQFFIDNADSEETLDYTLIGLIESSAIDIQAKELLPLIKRARELGIVDEFVNGKIEDVEKLFDSPLSEWRTKKLKSIYELAEGERIKWRHSMEDDEEDADDDVLYYGDNSSQTDYPLPYEERSTPKVGRNEPCPCGSGMKYKKCCGI